MRWSTQCAGAILAIFCCCAAANAQTTTTAASSASASSASLSSAASAAPVGAYPPPGSQAHTLHFLSSGVSSSAKCFCDSCIGHFLKNALKPVCALFGGGLGGQPGAPVVAGGPAAGGAGSTAAKIKADQAGANARRDAVRFLGTVDCHYYPEAEAAIIAALRTDRSECVRLEAALALSHGCCCTKSTIEALRITVSGSEKDGNPGETSPRVRIAAYNSLQGCCQRNSNAPQTEELPRPEPAVAEEESEDGDPPMKLSPYYANIERRSQRELLHAAEMTLNRVRAVSGVQTLAGDKPVRKGGTLLELWARSANTPQTDEAGNPIPIPAQPTIANQVNSAAIASTPAISNSNEQPSPTVIYSANRELPESRVLPPGVLRRLPDPFAPENQGPAEFVPDSSLPGRRATLY